MNCPKDDDFAIGLVIGLLLGIALLALMAS